MKIIKVVKDDREIDVSEKAYRVFYKEQGYRPAEEEKSKRSTKKVVQDDSR